jgi:large subunit ribosomal protein L35
MPKLKTKRSAAKRFKKTASGKLLRRKGWKRHLLEWKPPKRKRQLRKAIQVSKVDARRIARLIPYL